MKQLEDRKRWHQAYEEKTNEVRRDHDGDSEAGQQETSGRSIRELKKANDLFEDEMQNLKQGLEQKDAEIAQLSSTCRQREQEASELRE